MSDYRVASRYARSVFDLAVELKKIDRIYKDMLLLEQTCLQNQALLTVLRNPIIRYDYKLKILLQIFEKHVDAVTAGYLRLICRKNRAQILPETSQVFVELYHKEKGIVRAKVSSAVKLSAELINDFENIISKATGNKVVLETKVDSSLIGGYVLQVGDYQIDDSLKSKLNTLRRELKKRP